MEYTKIHPFSYGKESLYFEAGNEITGFTLKNFHIGMFICYDLRFPEVFHMLPELPEAHSDKDHTR